MDKSVPPGVRAERGLASGVSRLGVLGSGATWPIGLPRLPGVLGIVSSCGGELLVFAAVLSRIVGVAGGAIGVFCGTGCDSEGVSVGDDIVMQFTAVLSADS
jgi:hypothetical protein